MGSQSVRHDWTTFTSLSVYLGEGSRTPLQYSCLENSMDGGAWKAAVHEVTKSLTRLSHFTFTHWRRKWQPSPVFLPGESHGQEGAWRIVVHVVPKSWTWPSTPTSKVSHGLHHFSAFFLFLNFTSNLGFCFPFGYIFAFLLCYVIFLDTPLYQVLRKNKLGAYQLSAVSPRVFLSFFKIFIYLAVLGLFFLFIFLIER